ncbi:hypothetical protein [Pseudomonas sp. ML96]|uniref:hypothetical protein n=1 Tax=Pseudomonas sp. ML96 TaxID=1523503 RepID=UPI0005BAE664|nr:hypothetical protein [Pseudomonas sp. ML96]
MPEDIQSLLIAEVLGKLRAIPEFGESVEEEFIQRVLDADDSTLPGTQIVVQSGDTEELDRVGPGAVKERLTLHIALLTTVRDFGPKLRAGRLAIKCALAGTHAGLSVKGLVEAKFGPDELRPSRDGRRWAIRVMPLQLTYSQKLK